MSEQRVVRTGCKANVYLNILGRRRDGMHELESLFLPLEEPADTLRFDPAPREAGLKLTCSSPELATEDNILYRAYDLFSRRTGFRLDLSVHLEKRIPWGSGLGGASADAAALLSVLASLSGESGLDQPPAGELERVAADTGADVPFFLHNRPSWVQGIGEVLHPARVEHSGAALLVACPEFRISTAEAYRAWDAASSERLTRPGLGFSNTFCRRGRIWWNAFERVLAGMYPEIGHMKQLLLAHGAKAAVMSGSGSAMIALFDERSSLRRASRRLRNDGYTVFINAL